MELRISLQPKQIQFLKSVDAFPITFYGGAKGGGKSKGIRDIMLLRRFKYPKTHGGLFRRTYKELEGNHIRPLFKEYPKLRPYWNDSKKLLNLPNGSTLEFCHCEGEKDVELYQGREFEDLAIEESGQWTESMFKTLLGSNRSSTRGFKPRCLLTGNPGGVGHTWLKRIFIERRFTPLERPEDYNFIRALVFDNPALLENDPGYLHRLNSEPNEALRRAYRDGDWDIYAGQFFGEIRREMHLIKPFIVPPHWTRFGAYDYGFNHPSAIGAFAVDEDGDVVLYKEFYKAGLRVDQFIREALKIIPELRTLQPIVAGHDCWAKKGVLHGGGPSTIAEEWAAQEIYLEHAKIDRIQGAAQVRNYLAWQDLAGGRKKPRYQIFENCPYSFDVLTRMQTDPGRMEDVLKIDSTEGDPLSGDDGYDMQRYGLMSRPQTSAPLKNQDPNAQENWEAKHLLKISAEAEQQQMRQTFGIELPEAPDTSDIDDWESGWKGD